MMAPPVLPSANLPVVLLIQVKAPASLFQPGLYSKPADSDVFVDRNSKLREPTSPLRSPSKERDALIAPPADPSDNRPVEPLIHVAAP